MTKLISITIALTALTFSIISCGSDDDDSSNSTCTTCVIASTISTEYCDNGDSTMTVSLSGAPVETIAIPGGDFNTFITGIESAGGTCN